MITVTYYEVIDNGVDGLAFGKHYGAFTEETDAKNVAGGYMSVFKRVVVIHQGVESFKEFRSEAFKQNALAKLTIEERIALGLE